VGRIAADPFGGLLRKHLKDAGVDSSMIVPASQATTLAVAALDGHGKAEYSFYANGTADWQWTESEVSRVLPADARALYVGGLATRLQPGDARSPGPPGR
jgi:fructokinase